MKTTNEKQTNETTEAEQKVGYPDISKANTKTVVLLSFIVIVIVFFLSILFPPASTDGTTEQPAGTEATTEQTDSATGQTNSTTEKTSASSEVFSVAESSTSTFLEQTYSLYAPADMTSQISSPGFHTINGTTYYFQEEISPFTGWLKIDDTCYYIQEDGSVTNEWCEIDNQWYYFDENGAMQTSQWIDGRYLSQDGSMVTNTLTPDGIYVGADGFEDASLGTTGSLEGLTDLKHTLETMLSGYSGTWSVYVKDIANKEYLSINNVQHFSASLIKLYCAAAAYDLIEKGILEDTERIQSLMSQMISISDNDAFNLMVMACSEDNTQINGRPVIQSYINAEGYKDTTITSMLIPTKYKAPSSPGRNYTTVEDCGLLLEKIYKGKCVSPESSENFLNLLLNQTHIFKIPAGLPEGTKCANKTGDTDEVQHDAAIVYSPGGDYIISVMSSDCGAAIPNIQELSETVYHYFNP